MARFTIDIPEDLYNEIQERRHRINVSGVCREALVRAVARTERITSEFGRDIAEDLTRMFNGDPHPQDA